MENHPSKILGTTGRMTMKFLALLIWSVDYGSAKSKNAQIACFLETQLLDMLASQNFAGLSILTSEINPENFRSIS